MDDNSVVIRTKPMIQRGLPARRAQNKAMTRTHSARFKVRDPFFWNNTFSKQQTDQLGWPHLEHYRFVVRRFQHMQGSNTLNQSSSFILTSVSPRPFQLSMAQHISSRRILAPPDMQPHLRLWEMTSPLPPKLSGRKTKSWTESAITPSK